MFPLPSSPSVFDAFRMAASWAVWRRTTATAITAAAIRAHLCGRAPGDQRRAVISYMQADGVRAAHTLSRPADYPHSQLTLDAFEWLYNRVSDTWMRPAVYLDDPVVRRELATVADSFPRVQFTDVATGILRDLAITLPTTVSTRAGQRHHAPLPQLTVATDASLRTHTPGAGTAVVAEHGAVTTQWHRAVDDTTTAEILAIRLALNTYPRHQLTILTDSRAAIRCLSLPPAIIRARAPRTIALRIVQAQSALKDTRSTLTWVRGHADHPLNEAADRVALAVRRNHQFCVSRSMAHRIIGRIEEDLQDELDPGHSSAASNAAATVSDEPPPKSPRGRRSPSAS